MTDEDCLALLAKHIVVVKVGKRESEAMCSCGEWNMTDWRRDRGPARLRLMRAFHKHCIRVIEAEDL